MRGLQSAEDILAGTDAGVDETGRTQLFESVTVKVEPLALGVRGVWATEIGSFLPLKAEPLKVLKHGGSEFGFGTVAVQVFVAKDECSAMRSRALLGNPECAGMAKVQKARGRRSEATAV